MKINKLLHLTIEQFNRNDIRSAFLDAEILLLHILDQNSKKVKPSKNKAWFYTHPDYRLTSQQLRLFKKYIKKRISGKPIAQIVGRKEFYKLDFFINKNVLIPRPETEIMVESVLAKLKNKHFILKNKNNKIILIDIGTGSGCIPISILKNIPQHYKSKLQTFALDISEPALQVAKRNATKYNLDKKIKFIKSNLLKNFPIKLFIQPDNYFIITANLPYVSKSIYLENYANLKHEPKQALVAKNDGLELYTKLFKQIDQTQKISNLKNFTIYTEINSNQKTAMKDLAASCNYHKIEIKNDLSNRARFVVISSD